ncbi:MAG: hypothetical protein JW913_01775 [Chitinispirillaceae bacterium]|nr:hypothetical protein [Chitinispirillaceae bacterium]
MIIRVAMMLLLWWVVLPQICFSGPSSPRKYISQELIDTSVQRGFLLLNESADMAGVGFRHQRSIAEAKKIVKSLKEKARGDPNEKYILWKVGELEAQIYLEESDLIIQQMRQRQLTINELVDNYNKEVGKWRPDFATLYRIHKNMDQVDARKANELADSYNQRKRALSREAVYFLEKALMAGNADSARKELGYCLRNRLYLNVSKSAYKRLEDRVEGLIEAMDAKPLIEAAAVSANRLLDKRKITEARRTLDTAENRLSTVKSHLPQREAIAVSSLLKRAGGRLKTLEDSLVNVNISLLRSKGVEAADKYLQTVLRPCGVSHDKAASVDRMIISVRTPEESGRSSEIDELVDDEEEEENPVLDNIMLAAKKKAQEKRDSLQAIENSRLWQERRERSRQDSIARLTRAAQEAALRVKQQRADSIAMAVYTLIEKNDPAAARKLQEKERSFLERFLRPDELAMLKTTIEHFASAAPEKKSKVTYLTQVENKTKQSAQPAQPDANAVDLQANMNRAQEEILGIYTMLERNDIDKAYRRFQTNRTPLQKYLSSEAFSMLELSVKQAYEYYSGKK